MGTIINAIGIIIASLLGVLLKSKISNHVQKNLKDIMGLSLIVLSIGWFIKDFIVIDEGTLSTQFDIEVLLLLVLGTLIGSIFRLETRFRTFVHNIETKHSLPPIAEGFITASLIFCVGAMAIMGPFQEVHDGNITILVVKTILDIITAMLLAATLGIGVMFSSISVLLYQGLFMLLGILIQNQLDPHMITLISLTGNIMIAGLGINFLEIKKLSVLNMVPTIFLIIVYGLIV
jgi:uncharacterized membrane protein YqgA involved in biofilm formation